MRYLIWASDFPNLFFFIVIVILGKDWVMDFYFGSSYMVLRLIFLVKIMKWVAF